MKFLLTAINAKFIHSNPAIYSLRAGVGEKLQPYVELAEFTINESLESILEGIWKRQPKVIGFSCYIWNWKLIREILTELPKILPDTEIWLGGPEVTYDGPGLLSEFPQVTGNHGGRRRSYLPGGTGPICAGSRKHRTVRTATRTRQHRTAGSRSNGNGLQESLMGRALWTDPRSVSCLRLYGTPRTDGLDHTSFSLCRIWSLLRIVSSIMRPVEDALTGAAIACPP